MGEIGLKTHKNDCLRTFLEIKNVFDAFETCYACFWIALIILNTLPACFVLIRCVTWKILQILQRRHLQKVLKFIDFTLKVLLRAIWGASIPKNGYQLTFGVIKID